MEIHRADHPDHLAADLHELLAEEVGELGVRVEVEHRVVSLHGTVATAERRDEVEDVVATQLPGWRVDNHLDVLDGALRPPAAEEQL